MTLYRFLERRHVVIGVAAAVLIVLVKGGVL